MISFRASGVFFAATITITSIATIIMIILLIIINISIIVVINVVMSILIYCDLCNADSANMRIYPSVQASVDV